MRPIVADAERLRRVERRRRHRHRGEADAGVEDGDKLRHLGHGHAPRDHRPDPAAEAEAEEDEQPSAEAGWTVEGQRRHDGDAHADHAVQVALPRRGRMGEAPQGHDEEDAGDEVEKVRNVGRHRFNPSCGTWRACAA